MNLRHLPNAITGLRLAMAPVLFWLLWAGFYREALWVAAVAGASDAVDGVIAKRFGWQSRLGSLLDPVADKLLLGAAMAGLWLAQALPAWLVGLGTPWNTLQLRGLLIVSSRDVQVEWVKGRLRIDGELQLRIQDMASRVTTLDRLGSYRLSLKGSSQPDVAMRLSTDDGALQLSGQGSAGPSGVRFRGEAMAAEAELGALSNLLNIIGRRNGARSVISIG